MWKGVELIDDRTENCDGKLNYRRQNKVLLYRVELIYTVSIIVYITRWDICYNVGMKEAKSVIEEIQNEERDKGKQVMYYLPTDLAEEFKALCKKNGVPASRVIEKLIRRFMEGAKK